VEGLLKEKAQLQTEVAFARQSLGKHQEAVALFADALPVVMKEGNAASIAVTLINYSECLSNSEQVCVVCCVRSCVVCCVW
jgi:hypothetical protein